MNVKDVKIHSYQALKNCANYSITLTHLPTGKHVWGTGPTEHKLKQYLLEELEKKVDDE